MYMYPCTHVVMYTRLLSVTADRRMETDNYYTKIIY